MKYPSYLETENGMLNIDFISHIEFIKKDDVVQGARIFIVGSKDAVMYLDCDRLAELRKCFNVWDMFMHEVKARLLYDEIIQESIPSGTVDPQTEYFGTKKDLNL